MEDPEVDETTMGAHPRFRVGEGGENALGLFGGDVDDLVHCFLSFLRRSYPLSVIIYYHTLSGLSTPFLRKVRKIFCTYKSERIAGPPWVRVEFLPSSDYIVAYTGEIVNTFFKKNLPAFQPAD